MIDLEKEGQCSDLFCPWQCIDSHCIFPKDTFPTNLGSFPSCVNLVTLKSLITLSSFQSGLQPSVKMLIFNLKWQLFKVHCNRIGYAPYSNSSVFLCYEVASNNWEVITLSKNHLKFHLPHVRQGISNRHGFCHDHSNGDNACFGIISDI